MLSGSVLVTTGRLLATGYCGELNSVLFCCAFPIAALRHFSGSPFTSQFRSLQSETFSVSLAAATSFKLVCYE
jgi:hypothetical protein